MPCVISPVWYSTSTMIVLVRHGETDGNARGVLQVPGTPLSARGFAQAERVAGRIATMGAVQLLCSDLLRARQTADAICARSGVPLQVEPLLAERNFGDLRGTAIAELGTDPYAPDFDPPGGESWPAFYERVDRAALVVRSWAERTAGTLVVVSHGLFCAAFVRRHVAVPPEVVVPIRFDNTSVTLLELGEPFVLRAMNDSAHLHDAQGG
jgi:2,3-bisphosphoglycerate-dependent phosphoglycerate mutase